MAARNCRSASLAPSLRRAAGRKVPGLTLAVAAWMRYTSGCDEKGQPIEVKDPLAQRLAALWQDEPAATVAGFLALAEVFPPALRDDPPGFAADLTAALSGLIRDGAKASLKGALAIKEVDHA